jgi:hypothetical protein
MTTMLQQRKNKRICSGDKRSSKKFRKPTKISWRLCMKS